MSLYFFRQPLLRKALLQRFQPKQKVRRTRWRKQGCCPTDTWFPSAAKPLSAAGDRGWQRRGGGQGDIPGCRVPLGAALRARGAGAESGELRAGRAGERWQRLSPEAD